MKSWEPGEGVPTVGRLWLCTMFARPATHSKTIALIRQIGYTDLIILLNDSPAKQPDFDVIPGWPNVEKLTALARAEGVRVHWMTWLDPKQKYVYDAAREILPRLARNKVSSLQFDVEGEWKHRIDNHTEFTLDVVAPAFADLKIPLGISSFASLPKEVVGLLMWAMASHSGYALPQCYSIWQGKAWQKTTTITPGQIVKKGLDTWGKIAGDQICVLLTAWGPASQMAPGRYYKNGAWHGKAYGVVESLDTSIKRCIFGGVEDVGLWSAQALYRDRGDEKTEAAKLRIAYLGSVKKTKRGIVAKASRLGLILPVVAGTAVAAVAAWIWRK